MSRDAQNVCAITIVGTVLNMASLATVRDALLISRYQNIIDDVEFALLYDESSSRLTFPYSNF